MRSPRPPRYDEPLVWLRLNKHDLAPLTGTDTKALLAIAYCWKLYAYAGDHGRNGALAAVAALLRTMQPKCWRYAKALIPWVLDWGDEDRVWSKVEDELELSQIATGAAS